jgi:hypothetical protein
MNRGWSVSTAQRAYVLSAPAAITHAGVDHRTGWGLTQADHIDRVSIGCRSGIDPSSGL